tara:strand:- start:5764 stop:7278 length:1515 start_codon:yes stop_codon:yes gene_type:complete
MSIFSSGLSKDKHNEIFKRVVGTIIPIPSESGGVIVMWEKARLKISCILPPTTRVCKAKWTKVSNRFDQKDFEIDTPTLIMSGTCGSDFGGETPPIPIGESNRAIEFRRGSHIRDKVSLAALNVNAKDRIMVKPYRLANVYDNSNICWGGNSIPKTLREANNLFWSAPFNCDFGGPLHDKMCKNIEHMKDADIGNGCGTARFVHRQALHSVCQCSEGRAIPPREGSSLCSYCGMIWPDKVSPEIAERSKIVGGLNLCTIGLCDSMECRCLCQCCSNNCRCVCTCDLTDAFIKGLKDYATSDENGSHWQDYYPLGSLSWEDWTRPICGTRYNRENPQFMSYTGKCDGVFISYDKKFVSSHPEDVQRNHAGHKCIIGLYTMTPTGYEIDLGKTKINLPSKKVLQVYDMWETQDQRVERENEEYRVRQEQERVRAAQLREERLALVQLRRIRDDKARAIVAKSVADTELAEDKDALSIYTNYFLRLENAAVIDAMITADERPITYQY